MKTDSPPRCRGRGDECPEMSMQRTLIPLGLSLLGALCASAVNPLLSAPTLTSLFPAGGQRGTTVEVTATGTFDAWPVKGWVNSPLIEVKAAKDKGKLSIAIKPETPPGVYRLRVYDDTGASQLRPFLV